MKEMGSIAEVAPGSIRNSRSQRRWVPRRKLTRQTGLAATAPAVEPENRADSQIMGDDPSRAGAGGGGSPRTGRRRRSAVAAGAASQAKPQQRFEPQPELPADSAAADLCNKTSEIGADTATVHYINPTKTCVVPLPASSAFRSTELMLRPNAYFAASQWFRRKGFGFITGRDGLLDVFVHHGQSDARGRRQGDMRQDPAGPAAASVEAI